MSRNLGRTSCYFCGCLPTLEEAPRRITRRDAGAALTEFRGLIVANAKCPACEAQYIAWIDGTGRSSRFARPDPDPEHPIRDLSFRSSFDDEPGKNDLPRFAIRRVVTFERIGAWNGQLTEERVAFQ